MKVSILIPIYAVEQHIIRCARSLFNQSYENCEFIFVDDGSPDLSVERLQQVLDDEFPHFKSRVRIVHHSRNRGLAEARNTAMECASGDFLLFVDSDDWCAPNLVSMLVREQRRNNADLVSTDFFNVRGETTEHVRTHWVGGREGSLRVVLAQSFALPNRIWSLLIRADMVHRNGIRSDGSVGYGEDALLLVKFLYYARTVGHVDKALYYYRADSAGSYSNNITRKSCRSYIRSQILIWEFIRERDKTMRYAGTLLVGRMNLRRWLSIHSKRLTIGGLLYRIGCYFINKYLTLRSWMIGG